MTEFERQIVRGVQGDQPRSMAGASGDEHGLSKTAVRRFERNHRELHETVQQVRGLDFSELPLGMSRNFRPGVRGRK